MRYGQLLAALCFVLAAQAEVLDRKQLSYAPIPNGTYVPEGTPDTTTLLDFIKSRSDLSKLASIIDQSAGEYWRRCKSGGLGD